MARISVREFLMAAGVAVTMAMPAVVLQAQPAAKASPALGSVKVTHGAMANGQSLAAGTYSIRLTGDPVAPVVGQSNDGTAWVEFVQGAQVKGKELATVFVKGQPKGIIHSGIPAPGTAKVELLKGGEYLRVWLNRGGTQYLIHLAVAK